MSALGHEQTGALQNVTSALLPIATAKADSRKGSRLLCLQKRTCAVQPLTSAMGQKRTHAAQHKGIVIRSPHWCTRGATTGSSHLTLLRCSKLMTISNLIAARSGGRSSALALFNKRSTMHHGPTLELLNANRLLGTGISFGWCAGNCNYDLDGSRT